MLASMLLQYATPALAATEIFRIPDANPTSFEDIRKVVTEGESENADENIHANMEEAMCGGWDLNLRVNGVHNQEETVCPPPDVASIGTRCYQSNGVSWVKTKDDEWTSSNGRTTDNEGVEGRVERTNPNRGLIARTFGVPGRKTFAFGNILSGLGMREEEDGIAEDIEFNEGLGRRVYNGEYTGFNYPTDPATTCGFTTLCRPPSHPDTRNLPSSFQNHGFRDRPGFFCDHPCQRPLDGENDAASPGKPANWSEFDSSQVRCDRQQPYTDPEDGVKYACGGLDTLGPSEGDFCGELQDNGLKAGLCQDINNWVYARWKKLVHICLVAGPLGIGLAPIYLFEKGDCGFPREVFTQEILQQRIDAGWEFDGLYECCSDDRFAGLQYNFDGNGNSCITCAGDECRLYPETNQVIVNDFWVGTDPNYTFPADLPGSCRIGVPYTNDVLLQVLIFLLQGFGFNFSAPQANVGAWLNPPTELRIKYQDREYISFFREYMGAGFERDDMNQYAPEDDHKKEDIPVACYGMYDMAPEDAKYESTDPEDKRCVIAAYYTADDGDGDELNFRKMSETQQGRGDFTYELDDNPFNDPEREFDEENSLWFPHIKGNANETEEAVALNAFSLLNDKVFERRYHGNFSFALLATDRARLRATTQVSAENTMSSGSLMRTPDDTSTTDEDETRERRTMVEWWHMIETEMHKSFTPPNVRILLPTTWTIDLNPLDPMYTLPKQPGSGSLSPDIRSERIEVQVQAREDLLGDIVSFMERALLLRVEGEPIPIAVPIINPTEFRAFAQGWESWAKNQEDNNGPGVAEARRVASELLEYADRADNVRVLRAEIAKYAGNLLEEQKTISKKLGQWLKANTDAYKAYLELDSGINGARAVWEILQQQYREVHDVSAYPWCHNERFTAPIYSLLDPWLPGREFGGDTTGGYIAYEACLAGTGDFDKEICKFDETEAECIDRLVETCAELDTSIFAKHDACVAFVAQLRNEDPPGTWPTDDVCDEFLPMPPLLPQLPDTERDPDIILDFTAFREPQKTVKLPVLQPIQVRIDLLQVRPPGLEQTTEPEYPKLAPLPDFPASLSDKIVDSLPNVIIPSDPVNNDDDEEAEPIEGFFDAAIIAEADTGTESMPIITLPEIDIIGTEAFLIEALLMITELGTEYETFWKSLILEPCGDGECVKPGTEQDCIEPHTDPRGKCVHFEADLKERLQRIASRPGIFLRDDFFAHGQFRDPLTYGQNYCEREDWACQLWNKVVRKPREGWMVDISNEYDPDALMQELRNDVREATDNIFENLDQEVQYDMPQEEMFDLYNLPEAEQIDRRIERFEPTPLGPNETCTDTYCVLSP